ncbi:MAG: hypothetical protein M0R17_04835 [Candidatus Omnitrophica bacterium]|jgi:hypothetical protein|nr:hypothetical protein [Candidatus Omnitrophota bacterium]
MANTKGPSTEETWMKIYFEELQEKGFIKSLEYQPEPFILSDKVEIPFMEQLKTKTKISNKTLISKHIYTMDYLITWDGPNKFHKDIKSDYFEKWPLFFSDSNRSCVEVKNIWDNNNMKRLFTTRTQPFIFEKYNIFVNLVEIPKIFELSFIPKKIEEEFYYKRNTKKNKIGEKKFSWKYRILEDFILN